MEGGKMSTVPEILATNAAREASEHSRALQVVTDQMWPVKQRVTLVALMLAIYGAALMFRRLGVIDGEILTIVLLAVVVITPLMSELYHLRRRVDALTQLVLERERDRYGP